MGSIPGWEDPLEEGTATHSNILAWRIPWPEEPGGLQSIGSHRVRQDWSDLAYTLWVKTIQMSPLHLGRSWIHSFTGPITRLLAGLPSSGDSGGASLSLPFPEVAYIPWLVVPPSIFKVHHSNLCLHFFSLNILILLPPPQKEGPSWLHWAHLENSAFSHYLQILN